MIGPLMRIVSRALSSPDDVIGIGGGAYAVRHGADVVLAWSRSAARSLLLDGIPSDAISIDVSRDVHVPDDMRRSASTDEVDDLARTFDGRTVLLRLAQFGGHGGMPPGAGMGLGSGFGSSSPMAVPGQFMNYIARQMFDRSLDQARRGPELSGWNKPTETRLKDSELYGHTRTQRDHDMEPYELTFEDRVKLKKERYLDRVREMRRKKAEPEKPDPNSVAALKQIAPKPDDYVVTEQKLGDRRETDGIQFRPGYHGPESQFTHFPRPVTAGRKVEARRGTGYTTFDDMDRSMFGDGPGHNEIGGVGGQERYRQVPFSMRGPERENPDDIGSLMEHYVPGPDGGQHYQFNLDLLMDNWPHGTQPGDPKPVFTEGDKQRIVQLMRHRFYADEKPEGRGTSQGKTLEEKLKSRHRTTPTGNPQPTAADTNAEPYPYANPNMFGLVTPRQPRGRA